MTRPTFRIRRVLTASTLAISLAAGIVPFASHDPALAAPAVPPGSSAYAPVAPGRLADTRPENGSAGYTRIGPSTIRIQVTGRYGVADGASSAVVNIASANAQTAGFVTAYPAGTTMPLASSLNVDMPGRIIANMVTVRLGTTGAFDLYSNVPMDLIVDIAGAYKPVTGPTREGRMVTIAGGARRVMDTRSDGSRQPLVVGGTTAVDVTLAGVPLDATAVVVNLAAVDANPGFWTSYPAGETLPLASSLNIDQAGQTRNSQGIVLLSPGARWFNVFSSGGGHLVVDVVGWFTGPNSQMSTDGLFFASNPTRVVDTRNTYPMAPWGNTTIEFSPQAPAGITAGAVAMNIAIVEPWNVGFVTAHPAGVARPFAANVNVTAFDQIIANHAIVRNGTRGIAVYSQSGAHIIADVAGWYLGTPEPSTLPVVPVAQYNPQYTETINAPSIGLLTPVGYNKNLNRSLDAGMAAVWGGTGIVGQAEHNVFFGHRTSHGGPFLNLNRLGVGDTFDLIGTDGVAYHYLVLRTDVIWPSPQALLDIVVNAAPITATLVACHPPHSTKYRIAVTARLVGAG